MKTPEEWMSQLSGLNNPALLTVNRMAIREIQHDAWQQGMLDAAIHCTNFGTREAINISNQLLAIKDTKKL